MIPNGYTVTIEDEDRQHGAEDAPWTATARDEGRRFVATAFGATAAEAFGNLIEDLNA